MTEQSHSGSIASSPESLILRAMNDRFRIDAHIARGGMGHVYRATELSTGRACALKIVTADDLGAEEGRFVQRFVHEASMTAHLHHPNCVSVIDFGETPDGILYLAMELLEGRTLAQALREDGPFPIPRFLRVATEICLGVKAAHELGIVHRDLKTANIFLVRAPDSVSTEERVKVLDFGIAKRLQDTTLALTRPGQMLGTPTYMAPEQILDRPVDTRADIYSLGIVFYELLIGRVPFDGTSYLDILAGHAREPVPAMASIRPDIVVPAALENLLLRMLAKEPENRHPDVGAVLEELGRVESRAPSESLVRASLPSPKLETAPDARDRDARTRMSRVPRLDANASTSTVDPSPNSASIDHRGAEPVTTPPEDHFDDVPTSPRVRSRSRARTYLALAFALAIVLVLAAIQRCG